MTPLGMENGHNAQQYHNGSVWTILIASLYLYSNLARNYGTDELDNATVMQHNCQDIYAQPLNKTETTFPGTKLRLRLAVADPPI